LPINLPAATVGKPIRSFVRPDVAEDGFDRREPLPVKKFAFITIDPLFHLLDDPVGIGSGFVVEEGDLAGDRFLRRA
jgi:hypothetical protein